MINRKVEWEYFWLVGWQAPRPLARGALGRPWGTTCQVRAVDNSESNEEIKRISRGVYSNSLLIMAV